MFHPDELDLGILRELQSPAARWNVRKSYGRIAKKLHVDEETVRRRASRMESQGVVEGWAITPNPHLLGRERVGVYLETQDELRKKDAIEKLEDTEGITSVHSFHGNSLLVFLDHPTDVAAETQVGLIETICGTKSTMVWSAKFPPFQLEMTPTDWSILKSLRRGPRRRLNAIAREMGVSTRTVNRRMVRLVEGYAFYLEVLVDFQKIGGLAFTLVVRCEDSEKKSSVDSKILEKLGRSYEWSDTRSNPQHSVFSAFSENFRATAQLYEWVRSLDGVADVRMGIQEDRILVNGWIDREIESRSGASAQVGKEQKIVARRPEQAPAPRGLEQAGRVKQEANSWWTGSLVEGRHVKVKIDPDLCMGTASCVALAPKIFKLDWAKKKGVMEPAPLEVLRKRGADPETLFLAAQSCPYGVITLEDQDTGEQLYP